MKKIFIINGGQQFEHAGGRLNTTILETDKAYFTSENGFELRYTSVDAGYDPGEEVEKFVWADTIIYHFPIWWFSLPYGLKKYLDIILTAGHKAGIYESDGRSHLNPDINYGTGGSLKGRNYMVTTSWNAPETAFTLPGEFFQQKSVDEGVLFGFHRMNAFLSLEKRAGMHFHDVEKDVNPQKIAEFMEIYQKHLNKVFPANKNAVAAMEVAGK